MKRILLWLIPLVIIGTAAGLYFRHGTEEPLPEPAVASSVPAEPEIRYQIDPVDDPENPLPPLAKSDDALSGALTTLLGNEPAKFVHLEDIVHRIVVTVDNLPRDHVARQLIPVKPIPGLPRTQKSGEEFSLSVENAARYRPYVRLAEALSADTLVTLYARFYPLFQQKYEELGHPGKYFNDRVVEVIDHLLATPEVEEPLRLVQPRVLYEFADHELESLSVGQKILLRMGHANQLKLEAKLREIRQALVSLALKSASRAPDPQS